MLTAFCRDCLSDHSSPALRCSNCGSPRLVNHPELDRLTIAHIDCDAFYAAIEKRDDPTLRDKPVIIGGGRRGVVSTACYVARMYGLKSAMPMFQARRLCPQAVIIAPDMAKYSRVGRDVRALMFELSPLIEPLSIDEAFLDLSGTRRLHGMPPAKALARFAKHVENTIGITVSIGLSENKFLAKLASDLEKPRGYSILTRSEAEAFLAPRPVTFIWGVGKSMGAKLERKGFRTIADIQRADENELIRHFGAEGRRLARLSRGIDDRPVKADRETKSISAESTFTTDTSDFRKLERHLWRLSEKVSARLKAKELSGTTVTLKLKTADFQLRTRALSLRAPTQLAAKIFDAGRKLLKNEAVGPYFRLIGIGVSSLVSALDADPLDLIDERGRRVANAEHAIDVLRTKFGGDSIVLGRGFGDDDENNEP